MGARGYSRRERGRREVGPRRRHSGRALGLLREGAAAAYEDGSRDSEEEDSIFFGHQIGAANENASRLVELASAGTRSNGRHDEILQLLTIARRVFVEDDEIDAQTAKTPKLVRPKKLADELELLRVGDARDHDRQVARDRIRPKPRLSPIVARDDLRPRSQIRIHVEQAGRESKKTCASSVVMLRYRS